MAQDKLKVESVGDNDEQRDLQPQRMAAEMAKAFQELARGEQTASALEKQLDGIESRIDELLAAAEETERQAASRTHENSSTDKA